MSKLARIQPDEIRHGTSIHTCMIREGAGVAQKVKFGEIEDNYCRQCHYGPIMHVNVHAEFMSWL